MSFFRFCNRRPQILITMKRERISLFVLVVEIALIVFLHSARKAENDADRQLVKGQTTTQTYQLKTPATVAKP